MLSSAPIFLTSHYFRQNIWRLSSVQFHFLYIFGNELNTVNWRWRISNGISCNWSRLQERCELNLGTSWTLLCKRQLRYLGRNNLEGKYFHISNCILTMKGCADKKLFWDVFLRLTSCVFMNNFRFLSPALQVFVKKCHIFNHICGENIFLPK